MSIDTIPAVKLSKLVGHNILSFDLPYLIRWSIYNGVRVPQECTPFSGRGVGRYFPNYYMDTQQLLAAGDYKFMMKLDTAAKACGFQGKNGNGKFFYQMSQDDKEAYLANDVRQTKALFDSINHTFQFTQKFTTFDIETKPKSVEEIEEIAPEFDPDSIKLGNIKDHEKIQAKIEAARHGHIHGLVNKAGLHAHYSDPIAIGYIHEDGSEQLDFSEPKELVTNFWKLAQKVSQQMV